MRHMIAASELISEYVARGQAAFDEDSAIRDAIAYQIIVIGEAAKAVVRADETLAEQAPEIEWSPWARMKDRITHQYWATDPAIVWSTATQDVPKLRTALNTVIQRLSG
jgi:uncharacterized protein with HEPN domain